MKEESTLVRKKTVYDLLALAACTLWAASAGATEVYQWKDDKGETVFSSKAPKDHPASKTAIKVPPARSAPPRALPASPASEKLRQPARTAGEQPRPDPAVAAGNCSEARRVLQVLDTTPRPRFTDSDGQIKFMDEAQKTERRAEAHRQIEANCR